MTLFSNRLIVLALLGGLVMLFPADGLRALGLGEARVDSYLGQPLDVTIRLLEAESDAVEAMTVVPASPADHDRLGLPSEALGLGLDVSIDRESQPPTIRLRSQRVANDPIVQVLLDARFASGRVLREYTLFLDPPTIDSPPPIRRTPDEVIEPEAEPAPADPAPREERPAPRDPAPSDPEPTPEPAPEPAPEQPRVTDDAVTVARGDTLWGIGYEWRPDPGMSMDQVMLAIFERNRHAFMGENINRLRSGAELDMPSADEVRGVTRGEAERRIREHMQAWQQADPTRDVPVVADAAVPEADPTEPAPATAEEPEDVVHRLDVVPPEDDEFADGPAVSDGDIQRVRGVLADVEDEIASERLESEEFDEHVAEIREALDSRDMAGLAFAEESLAELEARLREARREREEEQERLAAVEEDEVDAYFSELERELASEDDDVTPVPDEEPAVAAVDEVPDPDDELAPADPATDPAEEAAPADEPVAAAPEPEAPTGLALWQWLAIAIAVIVVVLLAVGGLLFFRQRRNAATGASESAGTGDDEADARKAIGRDPANLAAHLALLKTLADRDDNDRFADALDQMYQHVDDEEDGHWQEALGLALIHAPDHPMLTPPETAAANLEDEELERRTDEMLSMFDVDDDDGEDVGPAQGDSDSQVSEPDEERLDAEASGEAAESGDDEDFGDDLDLGELSNRLDEPDSGSSTDDVFAADDDDFELGGFSGEEESVSADEADDGKETSRNEDELGLDLDFEPGWGADQADATADESAASDSDDADSASEREPDAGLEFTLDPEPEPEPEPEADDEDQSETESEPLSLDLESDQDDALSLDPETDEDAGLTLDLEDDSLSGDLADETFVDDADSGIAGDSDASGDPETFELDDDAGDEDIALVEADEEASDEPADDAADLSDEDAEVKLDLARAYMSVDLADSARTILEEVVAGGSPEKQDEARKLLDDL